MRRSHDENYFLQRFSRRRPKSSWSRINVDRVGALLASGRMREPGVAEVEAVKADGRWEAAYESQRNATVPPDLLAALSENEAANDAFRALGKREQYSVLLKLMKAPPTDARAARLAREVARLAASRSGSGTGSS